jgi:hypothetical protein
VILRGLGRIHHLQYFKSEQIHQKCLSAMETLFPGDDQMEEEMAHITIKADEVKENRHGGKKGDKGGKKAPPVGPARNNGHGRGQFARRRN